MFVIDKDSNRIRKIEKRKFADLCFREREHLQEWIANNPMALSNNEPKQLLLIIQKEFAGFCGTRERLDLLALDKQGNLVIIENKLDDSGKDVTWQALKYASYCSSLKKQQIFDIFQNYLEAQGIEGNSEDLIYDFLENEDTQINQNQRIIFVAANYQPEVTSTVMWLLNKYNLKIQCFKVTPYLYNDQYFINFEQILPVKEAEEYTIKMAEKAQDESITSDELLNKNIIRKEFWTLLLSNINEKIDLFKNISPGIYNWIGAGSGVRNIGYNFCVSKKYVRVELYIDRGTKEENEDILEFLLKNRESIEANFGDKLTWQKLETKRACRIKYERSDLNVFEKEHWQEMIEFLAKSMVSLERAFVTPLKELNAYLKNHDS